MAGNLHSVWQMCIWLGNKKEKKNEISLDNFSMFRYLMCSVFEHSCGVWYFWEL